MPSKNTSNYLIFIIMSNRELVIFADTLLKKAGYSYDGARLRTISREQREFEKLTLIKTPMGGQPKK